MLVGAALVVVELVVLLDIVDDVVLLVVSGAGSEFDALHAVSKSAAAAIGNSRFMMRKLSAGEH